MGQAVLQRFESIEEIRLSMPNRHCLPVDLAPLGLENRNEVFMPIDAPNGIIEVVIAREPRGLGRDAQGEVTQTPATAGARTP
jgi:urate oxidase